MRSTYEEHSASRSVEAQREFRDAWMIALLVGCVIIALGNLIGIGPWWLAMAAAVWMIGYGVFIARTVDAADVTSDTKGESIYYLGLLFTFAALVAALITFDWGTPGGDGSGTAGTIRNFGIALLTTIVGLAGRVWFTMSHESPGDLVDNTRSLLEDTVSQMKESLDRARDDLDIMAHKFRDSSAGLGELAEIISEGTRHTAGIIAEGTQQTAALISEGQQRTAETYDALDAYSVQITGAARSLAREMDRMNAVCDASTAVLAAPAGTSGRHWAAFRGDAGPARRDGGHLRRDQPGGGARRGRDRRHPAECAGDRVRRVRAPRDAGRGCGGAPRGRRRRWRGLPRPWTAMRWLRVGMRRWNS